MPKPHPPASKPSPFHSFWMGGYEGADHVNRAGNALDMASVNGHRERLDADYAAAAERGFRTVRESVGWRLCETAPGRFDFARVRAMARAASRQGVQIVWTLMHYGTPPDVDLHDDRCIARFTRFAEAAADVIGSASESAPVYNPINEIGFLSWAISETPLFHPYRADLRLREGQAVIDAASTESSGYEAKRRLVRAALSAIEAIRRGDPRARFFHAEPVVHVVAPRERPELEALAERVSAYQWQAWDLIAGLAEPELGGSLEALDRVGVNHYHSGQWEVSTEQRLWWHENDPRRRPLRELLSATWERYRRPLFIAETSHIGVGRATWLNEVAADVASCIDAGVPFEALCLYPLVDRPDWDDATHWHNSGLWNVDVAAADGRTIEADYWQGIGAWQGRMGGA